MEYRIEDLTKCPVHSGFRRLCMMVFMLLGMTEIER